MRIRDDRYGGAALRWQQLVIVLSGIAALIAWMMIADSAFSGRTHRLGWWLLWLSSANIAGAGVSLLIDATRRELHPDLLSLLMPGKEYFQAGDAQYGFEVLQSRSLLRLKLLVQNTRDGAGEFRVDFKDIICPSLSCEFPRSIILELAPAEIRACRFDLPMRPDNIKTFFARLLVTCKTSGRRVRFKRYRVLCRPMNKWVVRLSMLALHPLHSEYAAIELPLREFGETDISDDALSISEAIWKPEDTVEQAKLAAKRVFAEHMAGSVSRISYDTNK